VSYLHVFQRVPSDGGQPNGPLLQASDGNFYGTTRAGGANRCRDYDNMCGTVFRVTPGGAETVLYSFGASATDGNWPAGPLIQGSDGALYGLASFGGAHGAGTLFRITLNGTYSTIYSFGAKPGDGAVPIGRVLQASDGNFYGATSTGGTNHCNNIPTSGGNCGTIFRVTPDGAETILHSFGAFPSDGSQPNGSLFQASDGNLYGTTVNGGANTCSNSNQTNSCGTVFRITPAGAETIIYSFGASFTDGMAPQGPLIQGSDGALYGTTGAGGGGRCGGDFGCGTVFRMTTAGSISILHAFAIESRSDGYYPSPYLIQVRDGSFYGTTGSGGAYPADLGGIVFRLTPSGLKTTLYSFGPLNEAPSNPQGGVIQASDGAFYGVTNYNRSSDGFGTIFKLVVQ
jgi:uncharacterized repeat protein (TIGR03803 family)